MNSDYLNWTSVTFNFTFYTAVAVILHLVIKIVSKRHNMLTMLTISCGTRQYIILSNLITSLELDTHVVLDTTAFSYTPYCHIITPCHLLHVVFDKSCLST